MKIRSSTRVFKAQTTIEGAGVHLNRVFGNPEMARFTDPFLLLDDFRSNDPSKYLAGFPWHPHRGIETITYMLEGSVEHGDSMGNKGIISSGGVQWMTAGSGIIHQEMPRGDRSGKMYGFQLWANLPASQKMTGPRYREIKAAEIPVVVSGGNSVRIKVLCGTVDGVTGPVREIVTDPEYLDITVPANTSYTHVVNKGLTAIAYVFDGEGMFGEETQAAANGTGLLFGDGDRVTVITGDHHVRFLLLSGKPLGEPIAWHGPIVMNTEEELRIAFEEYGKGTFVK
jgi:redox-sensitive bicupin YhaK (pirin superfamily)